MTRIRQPVLQKESQDIAVDIFGGAVLVDDINDQGTRREIDS